MDSEELYRTNSIISKLEKENLELREKIEWLEKMLIEE